MRERVLCEILKDLGNVGYAGAGAGAGVGGVGLARSVARG